MGQASTGWIKLATSLIGVNGRDSLTTITRTTSGTYDPAQMTDGDGVVQTWQVLCAPLDFSFGPAIELAKETNIIGTKQLYIPGGTDYAPEVGDVVSLDKDWRILAILNEYETESVKCAYLVQIGV